MDIVWGRQALGCHVIHYALFLSASHEERLNFLGVPEQSLRDSLKLGYPSFRGILQTTTCWRYPYGVHGFPQSPVHGHSAVPLRQCPPTLYGTHRQRTRPWWPTARRT